MYSYDDRIRAVKLYIKLGKRIELTIKQLGYPTKNSLKSWHKEYELVKDLAFSFVRERSKYSVQQKQAAVEHYLNHGRCFIETIKALGYPCRDTLAAWLDEFHPDMRRHVVGRAKNVIYPQEFKQTAVIELCTREVSAQVISQKLGITRPTLYKWKDQLLGHEAPINMKHNNDPPPIAEQQELELQIQTLRRNIRQLQLENDILKKANELIKKDLGVDQPILTNREKTLLVDALRQTYDLSELLPKLDLARSSYFYHQARLRRSDKYADARLAMRDIFKHNHHCYGYRRMHAALGRQQVCLSEKVVRRLMKQECLVVAAKKRRRFGSYQGEISPAPENLINRDFHAATPNEKWLTDIIEFHIPAGKVYLSPIIDCFDGLVISWSIGTSPDANLVNTMLDCVFH